MPRFRFSIRTMAMVITVLCLLIGAPISAIRYQASQQRRALSRLKELGITPYYHESDWRPPSWTATQVRRWIDADAFNRYSNIAIPADTPDLDEVIGLAAQLNGLEGVSCGPSNLTEAHVRRLLAIPGLTRLSVGEVNLSGEFVREVINARQWKELSLFAIPLDDAMLGDLRRQNELTRVFFDASAASAPALEGLADCPKLQYVSVYRCRSAGGIARLARKAPSLTDVFIDQSTISAAEMREFADVGGMKELHFSNCAIECPDEEILATSPSLRRLECYKAKISMANLKGIVNHPALDSLALDGVFTDVDAEQLAKMPAIKSVAFVTCDLTDEGLQHFAKAKTLNMLILPQETRCTVEGIRRLQSKLPIDVYVGDLGEGVILGEATVYEAGGKVRMMSGN